MKKLSLTLVLLCLALFICTSFMTGCTNATWKNYTTLGCDFKIELYSGGELVRTWQSNGKVLTEANSDGWLFKDKATGKLVRVAGAVVVTEL